MIALHPYLPYVATIVAIMMAGAAAVVRLRSAKKPISAKKILLPPLGMSTGFFMFLFPFTHIPLSWALISFTTGMIFFAYPLIRTSNIEIREGDIYLARSKAFVVILLALLIIRMALHSYVEAHISIAQTGSVFFLLAFGMLLPWRMAMYIQFVQVRRQLQLAEKAASNT
ncbi:CcdC family protein [Mechercharimyces sp. CAU 1602]|uniref:CcdC family protein n=1 Tax=Mechercharimyces sp. CAU 1602 TaxID=2973933 RepID=UPI0021617FC2|nr:cytochrome c biogenesis protein CcdC [Mechercharimyces sp. CAU 1602]MCS1350434.1 cytochrome c biogenesis protein CcdC [Mechercharimyces sp. CAU 1602]